MLERTKNGELLFPIRGAPDRYFYAGRMTGDSQAVIARSFHGLLIVAAFDEQGNLLSVVKQNVPNPSVLPDSGVIRVLDDVEFYKYLHREFGFVPCLVRVKEFHVPGELFAVYHLPRWYQEFLADPTSRNFDEEERSYLPRAIKEWNKLEQFVLEWGNDYWLDNTGEVVAS